MGDDVAWPKAVPRQPRRDHAWPRRERRQGPNVGGVVMTLRRVARRTLDTPIGRPLLARTARARLSREHGRAVTVRYRHGMWEYEWPEGTIIQQHWASGLEATPSGWATRGYFDFD